MTVRLRPEHRVRGSAGAPKSCVRPAGLPRPQRARKDKQGAAGGPYFGECWISSTMACSMSWNPITQGRTLSITVPVEANSSVMALLTQV